MSKKCSGCKEIKENSEFYKRGKKWLQSNCKSCSLIRTKKYYKRLKENPEAFARKKKWRSENYAKNKDRLYILNQRPHRRFLQYRMEATRRDLSFNLTEQQSCSLFADSCYYCNGPGRGIDRLDSHIGYEIYNVVPCCTMCNRMKLDFSVEEFIKRCKEISDRWALREATTQYDLTLALHQSRKG